MTRLHIQHQRLYLPATGTSHETSDDVSPLVDERGRVRALVLALAGPADWLVLGEVWRGVQSDLDLPAPGIAVNGQDALQLWFSLADPVDGAQGQVFLRGLQQHYLAAIKPARIRLLPGAGAAAAVRIPPAPTGPERWSAFVAPDLAAVFADEPALDFEPGADAQAELLSRLTSISPAAFQAALTLLQPAVDGPTCPAHSSETVLSTPPAGHPGVDHGVPYQDARHFLLDVMNDRSVPMALRIQAAQALLPSGSGSN